MESSTCIKILIGIFDLPTKARPFYEQHYHWMGMFHTSSHYHQHLPTKKVILGTILASSTASNSRWRYEEHPMNALQLHQGHGV